MVFTHIYVRCADLVYEKTRCGWCGRYLPAPHDECWQVDDGVPCSGHQEQLWIEEQQQFELMRYDEEMALAQERYEKGWM
jgi:hypothetical protein